MPAPEDLAAQLAAWASQDVCVVVVGAVVAQDRALLARAHRLATTAVERQVVSIALAHLDGNGARVDDLARDHLCDHPDSALVAWISARTSTSPPISGGHRAPHPS